MMTPVDAFLGQLRRAESDGAGLDADGESRLHERLSALVLSWDAAGSAPLDALAGGLSALALHPDPQKSQLGQRLIFTSVAETLGDSFEPGNVSLHDQIFARVIDGCRRHEGGQQVDALLLRFGVRGVDDMLARRRSLTDQPAFPVDARGRITRVLVPSRVTLGADVAVTSIVLQKAARVFPNAECVVLGPAAVADILRSATRGARFVDCPYARHGGIMGRLVAWVRMVEALDREIGPTDPRACVYLDPDSRLTQLGLLPVVDERVPSYLFESRGFRRPGAETLGALTVRWLDEILGPDEGGSLYPTVSVATSDQARADVLVSRLRAATNGHVTAVNLGVGGNPRKRVAGTFELDLVRALLAEGGGVLLDKGVNEEVARVQAIVSALGAEGVEIEEVASHVLDQTTQPAGRLLVYQGRLMPFAALVAASDLYIGYDSAFQHVAAALGVPVIDLFVDGPNELFPVRWRPHSKAAVDVVRLPAVRGQDVLPQVVAVFRHSRESRTSRHR